MGLLDLFSNKKEEEQQRIFELEEKLSSSVKTEQHLQKELGIKEKELVERSELIRTLITELNDTKKMVQFNQGEIEQLKTAHYQTNLEANEKLNALLKENYKLLSERDELKSRITKQKESQDKQLVKQRLFASLRLVILKKESEEQLVKMNNTLKAYLTELQSKDQIIHDLRLQEGTLNSELTQYQREIQVKEEKFQMVQLEFENNLKQIESLKQELKSSKETTYSLQTHQQVLQNQHKTEVNQLKQEIKQLQRDKGILLQEIQGWEEKSVNEVEVKKDAETPITLTISLGESEAPQELKAYLEESSAEKIYRPTISVIDTLLETIQEHEPLSKSEGKNKELVQDEITETYSEAPKEEYKALNQTINSFYDKSTKKMIKPKVNPFFDRTDKFEKEFAKKTIQEIVQKIPEKLPSRYQVSHLYEDGWHAYGAGDIQKQHIEAEKLKKIADKPYIGRIDVFYGNKGAGDTFYIGVQGGLDDGKIKLISWQTEVANIYYNKKLGVTERHPTLGLVELDYLRTIDIENRKIVKLHAPLTKDSDDSALIDTLANKRGKEMDIIVATIQKEQNELIRLPINNTIIIQGSAGSGKSVIALHRISYLLYHNKNLKENSVAIFGPNELFLKHIQKVLPELGNYKVIQSTFAKYVLDFLKMKPTKSMSILRNKKASALSALKGSMAYKEYIAIYGHRILNDTLPWLASFTYFQDKEQYIVDSLDIGAYYEIIKEKPYYDRKNMILNWLLEQVKLQVADQEARESEKIRIIEGYVNAWVPQLLNKVAATADSEDTSDSFNTLLLTEVEKYMETLEDYKESMEHPDSTASMKKKIKQAIEMISEEVKGNVNSLIENQLLELTKQIKELADFNFVDFLSYHIENATESYIETKRQRYIKNCISEQLRAANDRILLDLRKALQTLSEKNIEKDFLIKFAEKEPKLIEQFKSAYVNKSKDYMQSLFLHKIESELIRMANSVLSEIEVKLSYEKVHHKPSIANYILTIDPLIHEINNYLKGRFVENHTNLLKSIRKDEYGIHEECMKELGENEVDWKLLNKKPATISYEDLPSLLHVYILMHGKTYTPPLSYLILDEAQDYLPYEIWAISKLTKQNGLMLIGDIGQNLNPSNNLLSWKEYEGFLEKVSYYNLSSTYRSTNQIVEVSNRIIRPFSDSRYQLSEKTYRDGPPVKYEHVLKGHIEKYISTILTELTSQKEKYESIAIIVKDMDDAEQLHEKLSTIHQLEIQSETKMANASIVITTPNDAKGLEFECVIIADLSDFKDNDFDRKLAYVATSRALHELIILHSASIKYFNLN